MGPGIFQASPLNYFLLNKGEKTDGKGKLKGGVSQPLKILFHILTEAIKIKATGISRRNRPVARGQYRYSQGLYAQGDCWLWFYNMK